MRTSIWFRSDLRVDNNPALCSAAEVADDGVVGVFLVCAEQWRQHDWGEAKIDFVVRSVESLERRLSALGIPLVVLRADRFDEAAPRLRQLADQLDIDAFFANREYEVNEKRRDREVEASLQESGRSIHWHHDQTVVAPGKLMTAEGGAYRVFSPFRRAWQQYLETTGFPEPLGRPEKVAKPTEIRESFDRDCLDELRSARRPELVELWPAGETEAHRRLRQFVGERIAAYKERRDLAHLDATSRLSPYLAAGTLSIRDCLELALEANDGSLDGGGDGVRTWISELVWREFYRHVLVAFPRVSKNRAFRRETEAVAWRQAPEELAAWCEGRTGIPFVDAGMRELAATGYMHNRLRMVTAMFLSKDLLLDWRLGERHFMRHLVDADLANNNGGWQWSASTGTDAAPYFRIFNPWTQSKRYDSGGEYIHRWVPELRDVPAANLHDADSLAPHLRASGYPRPVVAHSAARIRAVKAFEDAK